MESESILEAKAWLMVEPILPNDFAKRVRYVTDLSPEVVMCELLELTKALRIQFQVPRKVTDNMEDIIKGGMSIIVDLDKKEFVRWDKEDSALIKKTVIRTAQPQPNPYDVMIKSKKIENIVNTRLRRQ